MWRVLYFTLKQFVLVISINILLYTFVGYLHSLFHNFNDDIQFKHSKI